MFLREDDGGLGGTSMQETFLQKKSINESFRIFHSFSFSIIPSVKNYKCLS